MIQASALMAASFRVFMGGSPRSKGGEACQNSKDRSRIIWIRKAIDWVQWVEMLSSSFPSENPYEEGRAVTLGPLGRSLKRCNDAIDARDSDSGAQGTTGCRK